MPNFLPFVKKEHRLTLSAYLDDYRNSKDKEFFKPYGTQIYSGWQGGGKTVSAVNHMYKIKSKYPKAILVSNLLLNSGYLEPILHNQYLMGGIDSTKQYIYFQSFDELSQVLTKVNNGKYGVIYLIDEIHTYFNSVESMSIPTWVFTEISQQRKQQKVIIGTSQLFMRISKAFREQADNIIMCRTYGGVLTLQHVYDAPSLDIDRNGKLTGDKKKTGYFIQSREIRSLFDTYQKVVTSAMQLEQLSPFEPKPKRTFTGKIKQ